jgi:uncharacterized protein (TIGR02598 family)
MSRSYNTTCSGFSLVEVTIAMGIFAFVVVAILGLYPVGLKMRSDSALETRATIIATELMSSIKAAQSLTNVVFRATPEENMTSGVNLATDSIVFGYTGFASGPVKVVGRGASVTVWSNGYHGDAQIQTLARVVVQTNYLSRAGLHQVTIEVRPPQTNARPVSFSTLIYQPVEP